MCVKSDALVTLHSCRELLRSYAPQTFSATNGELLALSFTELRIYYPLIHSLDYYLCQMIIINEIRHLTISSNRTTEVVRPLAY